MRSVVRSDTADIHSNFDLINRYFQSAGKSVTFVENITDIDEPLLERAVRDNTDLLDQKSNKWQRALNA